MDGARGMRSHGPNAMKIMLFEGVSLGIGDCETGFADSGTETAEN